MLLVMLPLGRRNKFLRLIKLAYDDYPAVQNVPGIYANHVAKAAQMLFC